MGVQDTVASIFSKIGIPESVWKPIETVESRGDQFTMNLGTTAHPERSVGLFQLNENGGLGAGYSDVQLFDPTTNATIAANAMKPAYDRGIARGLTGFDLTQYVAYNSGWPTSAGVNALTYDSVVKAYDPLLRKAYDSPNVSNSSGSSSATGENIQNSAVSNTSDFFLNKLWNMNTLYIVGGSIAIVAIVVNVAKGRG